MHSNVAVSRIILVLLVVVLIALAGITVYFFTAIGPAQNTSPIIVYTADAYVAETTALESAFTNSTGIQAAPPKAGGSLTLAQEIAQGSPASVFISVSETAVQNVTLKSAFSGWAIEFAGDQMALAYSNSTNSESSSLINMFSEAVSTNTTSAWYDFYSNLTSGAVKIGISNPNADPAGFRAWIVLEAAGNLYAGNSSYFVDRLLANSGNVTGASAADLVAPLQAGQIQFLFIYKSDIVAQKLNMLQLPTAVNLGNPSYNSFYSQFSYTITSGVQKGSAIVLYITVPKNANSYTNSLLFVVYVIKNYQTIKPFGLSDISPAQLYNDTSVPSQLQQLIDQGSLSYGGTL
ncbi:MAG: extracellular solute-binding protein [Nitrososphaerales archaeon]